MTAAAMFLMAGLLAASPADAGTAFSQPEEPPPAVALAQGELGFLGSSDLPHPSGALLLTSPAPVLAFSPRRIPTPPEEHVPDLVPLPAPLAGAAVVFAGLLIRRHIWRRPRRG